MKFDGKKVAFGRHQTFAVRYGWLSKGFQAVKKDPKILKSEDAIEKLGVGKNMVESIGYWLRAFQLVKRDSPTPTDMGNLLFSANKGLDPYLEDEATIWLLHWLLVSNPELATSWYWFFNRYHKPQFTGEELLVALSDFVNDQVKDVRRPALSTLKSDASLLPRMYTQSKVSARQPIEEALDSPLALLRLVVAAVGERGFHSMPAARPGLPSRVLGFALIKLLQARNVNIIPIEDLMYARDDFPALGAVFRLTETELLVKLEELVLLYPAVFEINETAGIHQLYVLEAIEAETLLIDHYHVSEQGAAA